VPRPGLGSNIERGTTVRPLARDALRRRAPDGV